MVLQRVLVVDPDRASRDALVASVRALGLRAIEAPNPRRVVELMGSTPPDVVLLDPELERTPGEDLLERIREQHPGLPIVLLGEPPAHEELDGAPRADEWLARSSGPAELERLFERLGRRLQLHEENAYLRGELLAAEREPLVARSVQMTEALRAGSRCARSRAPVLISGEPGAGKRRLARHIHAHSVRATRPVVRVRCAAEEPSELERRLFGDADGPGQGGALLEIADGGTLLLEEVGELAERTQERLAAALRTGRLEPRAGRRSELDLRLVATSSQDLDSAGRLRPELLELASALTIELAPLRERRDDILPLAEHFAASVARELGRAPGALTAEAEERLLAWPWPGNVRELELVVRRAALLARGPALEAGLFGFAGEGGRARHGEDPEEELGGLLADMPIADIERIAILATLESSGGNKTEAARRLGLTARTLSNKLKLWRSQGLVA